MILKRIGQLTLFIIFAILTAFFYAEFTQEKPIVTSYSDFIANVQNNNINSVTISKDKRTIFFTKKSGENCVTKYVEDNTLITRIASLGTCNVSVQSDTLLESIQVLSSFIIGIIQLFFWVNIINAINKRNEFPGGSSSHLEINPETINITMNDVAGMQEAKDNLQEIIDFLQNPDSYSAIGCTMPKGVLLYGPPGTGKTLIARALAGTAKVPFFFASGSSFNGLFIGLGVLKIKNLFDKAKECKKCIIFIDEIDSLARKRGSRFSSNEDADSTLNQLLLEMDGFIKNTGIVVIGATNRMDILDQAVLRPGRLDRIVKVNLPFLEDRKAIFQLYLKKIKADDSIQMNHIARSTAGCSGAIIAQIVNEAAIIAVQNNSPIVTQSHLNESFDRVLLGGRQNKAIKLDQKDLLSTAYHEAGHAIVAILNTPRTLVQRVSIVPRGSSLGVTITLPEEKDLNSTSYESLCAQIVLNMGGRAAESVVFGVDKITSGAIQDIKIATMIARVMITKYGLSEKVGPIEYDLSYEPYGMVSSGSQFSDDTLKIIDKEVEDLVKNSYAKALKILQENKALLDATAELLMEKNTIDGSEIIELINSMKKDSILLFNTAEHNIEREKKGI